MARVVREVEADFPNAEGSGALVERLHDSLVGDSRLPLLLLLGAVVFVLLIACANIANLLLARSTARRSELAVRVAMGASRGALIRQVLMESITLGIVGGVLGTAAAWAGVKLLVSIGQHSLPRLDAVQIDGTVLAFSLSVSMLASVLFGAVPAFDVARYQPGDLLRGSGRGAVRGAAGVRPMLVAAQFALALMLLYGAGLLMRSFANLLDVDRGFDTENLLAVDINLPGQRYASGAAVNEFWDKLMPQLEAAPNVRSADAISMLLLSELPQSASITVAGRVLSETDSNLPVAYDAITPNLLRTLGIRLLKGRTFTSGDNLDGQNVAIVNEAFVKRFLPDRDPIGQRFAFGSVDSDSQYIHIVGVMRDARRSGADRPVIPSAFIPYTQLIRGRMQVLIKTSGDPVAAVPHLRAVVKSIDPLQPLSNVRTLDSELAETLAPRRFLMLLLLVFASAATVLAAIGIYGVIAYMVGRRTREFGLRMALGAQPVQVLRMVMQQAGRYVLIGVAVGWAGALAGARLLSSQLFGVAPIDTGMQLLAVALLGSIALLAVWLPARKATGSDPLIALRSE